jgi:penicillin amidase
LKHILIALISALAFITGIYSLYKPLGRELIPKIAPFFVGDRGIWGTIKSVSTQEADELTLSGIKNDIRIARDEVGIPHIYAESYEDALFGLGYISGRDRLFQIELISRLIAGETSQWFGPTHIEVDKFMLNLGLDRKAWDIIGKINDKPEYELIKAYSNGLNSHINHEAEYSKPFEYALMGFNNRYHRPVDAIRAFMFYHYLFSFNLDDFFIQELIDEIGPKKTTELFFHQLVHVPRIDGLNQPQAEKPNLTTKSPELYRNTFELLQKQYDQVERITGWKASTFTSNSVAITHQKKHQLSFAISGPLIQPSVFYEVYLHIGDQEIHGFTIPGIAGILFGSNGKVAWTLNPLPLNLVDFTILTDSLTNRREQGYTIDVRESNSIIFPVRYTNTGSVISSGTELIELSWVGLQNDVFASGLRRAAEAQNTQELYDAFQSASLPLMQVTAFDEQGLAAFISGKIPKRKHYLGLQTWKERDINRFQLENAPFYRQPSSDKIIYANQYPVLKEDESFPYFSKSGFWRSVRINELVEKSKKPFSVSSVEQMLNDILMYEKELKPTLTNEFKGKINSPVNSLGNQLRNWDFEADKDASYPKFFSNFEKIVQNLTYDEFPRPYYPGIEYLVELIVNEPENAIFDIKNTRERETGIDIFNRAMNDAYDLSVLESGAPENWTWAVTNRAQVRHISNNAILNQLNEFFVIREGTETTVLKNNSGTFEQAPILRFTATFDNDQINTRSVLFSGNSANRYSPFYENQLSTWVSYDLRNSVKHMVFDSLKKNGYLILSKQ